MERRRPCAVSNHEEFIRSKLIMPAEAVVDEVSQAELADPVVKKKVEYVQKHAALDHRLG